MHCNLKEKYTDFVPKLHPSLNYSKYVLLNNNGKTSFAESTLDNGDQNHSLTSSSSLQCRSEENLKSVQLFSGIYNNDINYCAAETKFLKHKTNVTRNILIKNFCINIPESVTGGKITSYRMRNNANRKKKSFEYEHLPLKEISTKTDGVRNTLSLKEKHFLSSKLRKSFLRSQVHFVCSDTSSEANVFSNLAYETTNCSDSTTSMEEHILGTTSVDAAAHLKLLGDSLQLIGEKLLITSCEPSAAGVYSILLDSLLCSVSALLCLSKEISGLEHLPSDSLLKTLDHIAYFFPGL